MTKLSLIVLFLFTLAASLIADPCVGMPVAQPFYSTDSNTPFVLTVYNNGIAQSTSTQQRIATLATSTYSYMFIPSTVGTWTAIVTDSTNAIVRQDTYNITWSTQAELALGLPRNYHAPVPTGYSVFFHDQAVAQAITSASYSAGTITYTPASISNFSSSQSWRIYGCSPNFFNAYAPATITVSGSTFTTTVPTAAIPSGSATTASAWSVPSTVAGTTFSVPNFSGTSMYAAYPGKSAGNCQGLTSNEYMAFLSTGKMIVPRNGPIYGIRCTMNTTSLAALNSLKFIEAHKSGSSWVIDAISSDLHSLTAISDAYGADGFKTYYFAEPIAGIAGDAFGFCTDAPSAQQTDAFMTRSAVPTSVSNAGQEIVYYNSNTTAVTLGGTYTVTNYAANQIDMMILMDPPSIEICGNSIPAGFKDSGVQPVNWSGTGLSCLTDPIWDYDTNTVSTATNQPLVPAYDVANLLQQALGVPVENAAVGGSSIYHWLCPPSLSGINPDSVGGGWLWWILYYEHPSAIIFEETFNSSPAYSASNGPTPAQYLQCLDCMKWQCDQFQTEFKLGEAISSISGTQNTTSARETYFNQLRDLDRVWATQNQCQYLSTYYQIGQNFSTSNAYAGTEQLWQRWGTKQGDPFGWLPDYQGASVANGGTIAGQTHLNLSGIYALETTWLTQLKHPYNPWPQRLGNGTNGSSIVQFGADMNNLIGPANTTVNKP